MARMVKCVKLGRDLEGLEKPPWPGPLGQKIFEQVSKEAWKLWLGEATKLLNESRLDVTSPAGQALYASRMEAFFFGPPPTDSLKIL